MCACLGPVKFGIKPNHWWQLQKYTKMLVYLIIKTFPLPFPTGLFLPVRIILVTLLQWVGSFAMKKKKKIQIGWAPSHPELTFEPYSPKFRMLVCCFTINIKVCRALQEGRKLQVWLLNKQWGLCLASSLVNELAGEQLASLDRLFSLFSKNAWVE